MSDIRTEVHALIDALPERALYALRPLLSFLAETGPLIIETDLTDEERAIIAEGDRLFKEHPETFVPLESIR
jgi:hypothetical protein